MNKKKAIKLVTASALAASSFAAVAPFNTEAAVNVAGTVTKATTQMEKAYNAYYAKAAKGQAASAAEVQKELTLAKTYYDAAKKVVSKYAGSKKSYYLSKLNAAMPFYTNAQKYISGAKYAEGIKATAGKLETAVISGDIKTIQNTFPAFASELNKAEGKVKGYVAGSKAENAVIKANLTAPKAITPAVNAYFFADKAAYWVSKGDLATAEKRMTIVTRDLAKVDVNSNLGKVVSAFVKTVQAKIEAAKVPTVTGVSAINGKQIVVTFNKAVDKDSVLASATAGSETAGTLLNGVFTINELSTDGVAANSVANADSLTATLSDDGKTLTINADTYFDGRYEVVTKTDAISTVDGKTFAGFSGVVTVNDTTKPEVSNVQYVDYQTARVNFSEPLNGTTPSISAKYDDGTAANVSVTGVTNNYVTLDLTSATANKNVVVTLVGVKDAVGNLVNPNPVTVTVKKDTSDTVAPTVSSVTRTSATGFDVKFSEPVSLGTSQSITVGGTTITTGITVDSTDKTLVHVTGLSGATTGLVNVSIAANSFVDFSGNGNALATKVYDFTKSTAQPTVQSYSVKTINNVQYLVVDYNENVSPVDAVTLPAYYTNSVGEKISLTLEADTTSSVTSGNVAVPVSKYNPDASGNSKSLKFDLTALAAQNYTVDLSAGLATDGLGNTSLAKTAISFAKGATTPQEAVVTSSSTNGIDYASTQNNNELYVHFTQQLDIASAQDANNYTVQGATVQKAEIFKNNSTDGYIVKLTLAQDSVDLTGTYEVTVKNVKGMNATAMNPYTTTETLTENVAPKATSAVVTSVTTTSGSEATVLTLTFDQNVAPGTGNAADFDLYLKGTIAPSGVTVATTDGTANDNKLVVTITGKALSAQDIADGVELRAQSTIDITDILANGTVVGNKVLPTTTVRVGL